MSTDTILLARSVLMSRTSVRSFCANFGISFVYARRAGLAIRLPINDFIPRLSSTSSFIAALKASHFQACEVYNTTLDFAMPVTLTISSMSERVFSTINSVSYTHLRAHETRHDLVCRL